MKTGKTKKITLAFLVCLCVAVSQVFGAVSIPITVTEPSGVARTGEGLHSGVPFKKGAVKSPDYLE